MSDASIIAEAISELAAAITHTAKQSTSEMTIEIPSWTGNPAPQYWRSNGTRWQFDLGVFHGSSFLRLAAWLVRPGLVEIELQTATGERVGLIKLLWPGAA